MAAISRGGLKLAIPLPARSLTFDLRFGRQQALVVLVAVEATVAPGGGSDGSRIHESEAEQVRSIFELYLRHGSIPALKCELDRRGMRTRRRQLRNGDTYGDVPFFTGALSALLRNRTYIGEIIHKGEHHPGEHAPIIDAAIFEAVQQRLAVQRVQRSARSNTTGLLTGLIFDARGNRMSPSHAVKHGVRYPYYVSRALLENRKNEAGDPSRVNATVIDDLVLDALRQRPDAAPTTITDQRADVLAQIERVEVHKDQILVTFANPASPSDRIIGLPFAAHRGRPAKTIHEAATDSRQALALRQSNASRDRLLKAILKARAWFDDLTTGRATDIEAIAQREGRSNRNIRMMIQLAFLDPAIVEQAVDGVLPPTLGATEIVRDLPLAWHDQRQALGV